MNTYSVTVCLRENRAPDKLFRQLLQLGALEVMPWQWIIQTRMTIEQLKTSLQGNLDPSDRLVIAKVDTVAAHNPFSDPIDPSLSRDQRKRPSPTYQQNR